MSLEIGVFLPTSTPDPEHPILGDVRASARFAEEVGLDSIWSTDHLIASAPMLDSTVTLATAAAVTERIKVGYNVMLLALRPVAWAAKQIGTLQYVSGDRLIVGVGTGNPAHGDIGWRAAGVSFEDRGRRTDEGLRVLPDLVAGRTATVGDGLEVTLAPGAAVPPILVAGNSSRARRRAADYADGWITIQSDPERLSGDLAELRELAAARDRAPLSVAVVAAGVSRDVGEVAAQMSAFAAQGVSRVVLVPTGEQWQRDYEFAAKVRAAL
ncbi:alkanesulfonate monooxygenase SsuD/methylene tetrahydromethanopterin reductase-like flavin-dependent oxidoreductase (luciferase family) [Nocardia tenerifensis]|uniref:Alkanesulfonate monooxygenase SsuD/methylene tetrahydromethanopterin reductase-like flavin-dependent oxidoreductase (Luciferase family) n=1 Tax=Nocardia tenerifensis TaxID=228006 RepID=A0A318K450_9NOCA|nr:LLM class flavin-dependent oxidoreductase [Nocardia tenerifensis]PXX66419.1 alkanesulfonate monooxygenase SsuD/methylene tetrahydromethanopterin reductase-like flavin-dependent oxidoreductase (luciferase family) [Nocardia tenerifensis]